MARNKPMIDNLCCPETEILSELMQDTRHILDEASDLKESMSNNDLKNFLKTFEGLENTCLYIEAGFDEVKKFETYSGEEWYKTIKKINRLIEEIKKESNECKIINQNMIKITKNLDEIQGLCIDIECSHEHTSLFGCNNCSCHADHYSL